MDDVHIVPGRREGHRDPLRGLVGWAALLAPALHLLTDVMEWLAGGFTPAQLWLNYVAFLPMSWLLLGIHAAHPVRPGVTGLAGAVLYGAAFTYFAFTALFALATASPAYATLWSALGPTYTVHGAFMVLGGGLFGAAALRARWLPRWTLWLFLAGLALNLLLALVQAPAIGQTFGSAVRNAGLIGMGLFLLQRQDALP